MNHKSIQILRTRLNNTDTKIANEVLLDGQPFYNKTSNKLYVGDGTKKISELKYIGQEAWDGFNLELDKKLDKTAVVQTTGNSETDVMSQKAVTNNFLPANKSGTEYHCLANVAFLNKIQTGGEVNISGGSYLSFGATNKQVSEPSETGRMAVEPNSNPTETSLVTVSSTGTHAYKKVSELVDTTSEQTLTGTKTWEVVEPGITHTLGVSSGEIYSKSTYSSNGTQQRAAFFSGGITLNKSTESNPIGDYTSISFPYLVNHTDDVYKFALAPDAVPTEPSVIVNATDRHVTWKPLSELEVSVPTRSQVDLLF